MAERDDLRASRERKLEELAGLGLPYLPATYGCSRSAEEVRRSYAALEGSRIRVAGRLMRIRVMGKAAFAHIQDSSGQLQLYFKLDVLGEANFQYFKLLDLGDVIGVEGTVFKTKTGEESVQVEDCVLLAKAYLPLPEKWHGLSDVETRYRQRYLDLISNAETRGLFQVRSSLIQTIRRYLDDRGFMEVETPTLQAIYGGAAATPFTTHYEALDADVYLRIATELYLKRLIVGGFERVYEIGKDFRNEGFSRKHSPEFTMVELYQAYADYRDMMALIEDMLPLVAQHVLATRMVCFDGHDIDLSPPWKRITIVEALQEYGGIDRQVQADRQALLDAARGRQIPVEADDTRGQIIDVLVSKLVEPKLIQPTFLYDFPIDFPGSLLAKRTKDDPQLVERFELYLGGMEVSNAFTELNDPRDQRARMEEASHLQGEEYQQIDRDFLLALEYGMPPTGGLGLGIDRIMMILGDVHHIRETILFPLLRPDKSDAS